MKRSFFLFFLLFFAGYQAFATHNRAGEITYRALDTVNNPCLVYEITVTTYTKCESQADRCTIPIDFGDGTKGEFPRVNGPMGPGSFDLCNHTCNGQNVGQSVDARTKKNIYRGVHTYLGASDYWISIEDPNRNSGIINLGPGGTGAESVNIPFFIRSLLVINPFMGTNNSPILSYPPIDNACTNRCFYHNPAAFDKDGDSLSYELTSCLTEGGNIIPGFTQPNYYGGGSLTMDAVRGDFIWCSPNRIGEYNAAFFIKEWRKVNGTYYLIGEVERDMQIDVGSCDNQPPVISPIRDTCVIAGSTLNLKIHASDPDGDIIDLSALGGPFSPFMVPPVATFNSASGAGNVAGTFNWQTACVHIRQQPYLLTFRAVDHDDHAHNPPGPPVPLTDIKTISITVVGPAPTGLAAHPQGSSMVLSWNKNACVKAVGYKIYRKKDCSPWVHSPCETDVPPGSGYILIGTTSRYTDTTFLDDNKGQGLVQGVSYSYMVVAEFPDGSKSYASTMVCAKLVRDVPVITNVDVITTDAAAGSINVKWLKPLADTLDLDTNKIGNGGHYEFHVMRAKGFLPKPSDFVQMTTFSSQWYATLNDQSYLDPLLNTQDGPYTYRVDFYCYNDNSGKDTVFKGSTQTASSVYLSTSPADNRINLSWEEHVPWTNYKYFIYQEIPRGSGTFVLIDSTAQSPYVVSSLVNGAQYCFKVESKGQYSDTSIVRPLYNYSEIKCDVPKDKQAPCPPLLTITADCVNSKNGLSWTDPNLTCADDVIMYKVYYKPTENDPFQLAATIDGSANITFTHSSMIDNLTSIIGCYAVTALDSFMNESVLSNLVCVDTCQVYDLPNVFSPDNNGINDLFIPLPYRYVKDVDLKIYDRWGLLMFETKDPAVKWDGKNSQTGKPCPEGTYFYVCTANLLSSKGIRPKMLRGFVQLTLQQNSFER